MYTFKKEERLCNKRLISGLYHNGSSFLCYPFKVLWVPANTGQAPAQIVFNVAKRRYKRAVDRNLITRRMREAYRLYKQELLYNYLLGANKQIIVSVNYIGTDIADYGMIEKKMIKLLMQLCDQINK